MRRRDATLGALLRTRLATQARPVTSARWVIGCLREVGLDGARDAVRSHGDAGADSFLFVVDDETRPRDDPRSRRGDRIGRTVATNPGPSGDRHARHSTRRSVPSGAATPSQMGNYTIRTGLTDGGR